MSWLYKDIMVWWGIGVQWNGSVMGGEILFIVVVVW